MNNEHTQQVAIIERDMCRLAERFDRHLEIYAKNNKELQAVKNNQAWLMRFFWAFMTPILGALAYLVTNIP